MSVIWHDLECGAYVEDLALWCELAAASGDPVLEIGAGTGRVALHLARHGHRVTALDRDRALVAELGRRAQGLEVSAVVADARDFELDRRFALCIVPMQMIQLLGGREGRLAFLRCARRHLVDEGLLAASIAETLELYEARNGTPAPQPEACEVDGVVYLSQPTAVRADRDGFVLERHRESVTREGRRSAEDDVVRLDRLHPADLEQEAVELGMRPAGRASVPATPDYVGSAVVMLRA